MAGAVKLVYHQATFDLLGEEPVVSSTALKDIEAWEQRYRTKLPAAVREWYSLEAGTQLCRVGQGNSMSLQGRFGDSAKAYPTTGPPKRLSIYFGSPYSGDLVLDGPEDPPITHYSTQKIVWESFSQFVLECLWGRLTSQGVLTVLFTQAEPSFGPAPLDFLTEHFQEVPRKGSLHGGCKFRFYRSEVRVAVTAVGDPTCSECRAAWKVAATSEAALLGVLREVRPFLSPRATCSTNGAPVETVLQRLRNECHEPHLWRPDSRTKR
jgi:hypothetical protein